MSRRRTACCCVRGNDGSDPPEVSDCYTHASENPAVTYSFDLSDIELISEPGRPTNTVEFKSVLGSLKTADHIIANGWYSDQWWKWDCNSMQDIPNAGCGSYITHQGMNPLPNIFQQAFHLSEGRSHLVSGDVDEPDMGNVVLGFCPAPFSQQYQGGPDVTLEETARTARSWYTEQSRRSVVIKPQGAAFCTVTPINPDPVITPHGLGGDPGSGTQYPEGVTNPDFGPHNTHGRWNIGEKFYQVSSAQMICDKEGEGESSRTAYRFMMWLGRFAQFDALGTGNGCYPEYFTTPNPCGFQSPCIARSLNMFCPCSGGADAPWDGYPRFGLEECNSMYDGSCGRFCRCKWNRRMISQGQEYYTCFEQSSQSNPLTNTFDGCSYDSCGASCFTDCYQEFYGQCNCPPFSPDNYWRDQEYRFGFPNTKPYDPPLHLCSSLCAPAGNFPYDPAGCTRNGCTAPEANVPPIIERLGIMWPYSETFLDGDLSPQEYFSQLTDEQNEGRSFGFRKTTGSTLGDQRIPRRLTIT